MTGFVELPFVFVGDGKIVMGGGVGGIDFDGLVVGCQRLRELLLEAGIDSLFLPISADLEYLTGIPRREPSFGNVAYRHGWAAGAFLRVVNFPPRGIGARSLDPATAGA